MKSVGILVDGLGHGELGYFLTKHVNRFLESYSGIDVIVYSNLHSLCLEKPLFPIMQLNEHYGHNGPLIATSIDTALFMQKSCNRGSKVFYVWDLEFLRHNTYQYAVWAQMIKSFPIQEEFFVDIYTKYPIFTRSQDHTEVIEKNFNVKTQGVIPDFQLNELFLDI